MDQPEKTPLMMRHQFPEGPWQCPAIDLMGPLLNQEHILLMIDYYSRYQGYQGIKFLNTTISRIIINHLSDLFSRLGLIKTMRNNNGRQLTSQELKKICQENGIKLIHTPP